MGVHKRILLAAIGATCIGSAAHSQTGFSDGEPRRATVADMRVLDPYVGRFRSQDQRSDEGIGFHYEIDYDWYDREQTILKYRLFLVRADGPAPAAIGEGYYYFDRGAERIGVFGVFPDGRTGAGAMGEFDPETHARAVWVRAVQPDGSRLEVHDAFEMVDADHWRNVTHIRPEGGEWRQIGSELYTRVAPEGEG